MARFDLTSASPAEVSADLLILPFYQGRVPGPGVQDVGAALGGDLMAAAKDAGITGKLGDALSVPTFGRIKARAVLLVGMGPEAEADEDAVRRAAQRMAPRANRFQTVASTLPAIGDAEASAHAFAEGMTLGTYRFTRYKERPIDDASKEKSVLSSVVALVSGGDKRALKEALRRGQVYAEAANWARDLVNTPALDATPDHLAREAAKMAALKGLTCKVWRKADLEKGGFGGILGVGAGSANDPRLIELTYTGAGKAQPIAITGKGITFDSGGLSIKDASNMEWMKGDMGGAAAALAVMRALADLKPKINVIAAIPTAENMPSGTAIRPGDVLRHRGGKTSEVLNTDAEGRLVLADALAYLSEKDPVAIIDSATLTGAAVVALGEEIMAVFGNDQTLVNDLLEAGRDEGEPGWQLPLYGDYRKNIESNVADVKNIGIRWGGAITAALFLREFVGDVPWAHLDVAGPAFFDRQIDHWSRGATGSPARTILRYLESHAARNGDAPSAARGAARSRRASSNGSRRSSGSKSTRAKSLKRSSKSSARSR
jgi:leucyl aminopeptidase